MGPKTMEVNGEQISAETVLIAAGTRPMVPEIPGLERVPYITSDEAVRLPKQPRRLAILGGGYIAAEMAHFFGALGTEVTLIHRGPQSLRAEDDDVARRFTEVFQRKINMLLNTQISRADSRGDEIVLRLSTNGNTSEVVADGLLVVTGRVPNKNAPGVWALGDIVGKYLLKHSANLEASYAGNNIFNPESKFAVDYNAMPHAIFASSQVAGVGLTESEAKTKGIDYATASYDYYDNAYGSSIEDRDGFVKVLAERGSGEILGAHIIGTDASMLIQEVVDAMRAGITVRGITQSIYVHPVLPEVVQRAFGELDW